MATSCSRAAGLHPTRAVPSWLSCANGWKSWAAWLAQRRGTLVAGVTGGRLRPLPAAESRAGCLRRQIRGSGRKGVAWASRRIFSKRITARNIEQMETASAAGWQKPWITTGQNTLQPVNAATRREYRGVNVLMLWAAAEITGYQDGRWANFKQWQQIGAQVRRGEKGTPMVFDKKLQRRGG